MYFDNTKNFLKLGNFIRLYPEISENLSELQKWGKITKWRMSGQWSCPTSKTFFGEDTFYVLLCVPNVMVAPLLQRTAQYKTFELLKFFICWDFYTKFSKENLPYFSRRNLTKNTVLDKTPGHFWCKYDTVT